MSHITLEEYIAELPQSLTRDEKIARANEWKQSHAPKSTTVEKVEEGKQPVTAEKDTTAVTSTPNVSAALEKTIGQSRFGTGQSLSLDLNQYDNIEEANSLIDELNKTKDFTKIYAFNEENPGYIDIEAIKDFEKKYNTNKKKQEEFTAIVNQRKKLIQDLNTKYDAGDLLELNNKKFRDFIINPELEDAEQKEDTTKKLSQIDLKQVDTFADKFEKDIQTYDNFLNENFRNKEGEIEIYTEEGKSFLQKILDERNSLAEDAKFAFGVINGIGNLKVSEDLRDESGMLKDISINKATYDVDDDSYGVRQGYDQRDSYSDEEASRRFKDRTGREPSSILEITAKDYLTPAGEGRARLKTLEKERAELEALARKNAESLFPENKRIYAGKISTTEQENFVTKELENFDKDNYAESSRLEELYGKGDRVNFAGELGLKLKSGLIRFGGKVLRLPTFYNEILTSIILDDKSLAALNSLPPEKRAKAANSIMDIYGGIGGKISGKASNFMLDVSERMFKASEDLQSKNTQFDIGIGESFLERGFASTLQRLSTEALGSAVSLLEVSIPYFGIPLLIAGEAASASREKQIEGEDLSLSLTGYSLLIGTSEGALEGVTRGIAKKAFGLVPKSTLKQAKTSVLKIFKNIGVNFLKEGGSEEATLILNQVAEALYSGDIKSFEVKLGEAVDTFLIGGAFGAKITATGAGGQLLKQGAVNRKVNKILDNSNFETISDAFNVIPSASTGTDISSLEENTNSIAIPAVSGPLADTSVSLSDAQIEMASIPGALKILNTQLKESVSIGEITQEQADATRESFISVQSAANTLQELNFSKDLKVEATNLMLEQKFIKNKIEQAGDYKALVDPLTERSKEIDARLKELSGINYLQNANTRKGAEKMLKQIGVEFETFKDQDSYDARVKEIDEKGGDVVKSVGYGQAAVLDGKSIVLINDLVAAQDNVYTTDQHEVLHPFFLQILKGNKEAAARLGKALMSEIINNKDIVGGAGFLEKFEDYVVDKTYTGDMTWDEVIPIVSEALSNGDIKYNPNSKQQQNFLQKIKDLLQSFFKKNGLNIKFNTGKDVFDFLLDYNNQIEKSEGFTEAQLKLREKGAQGALIEGEVKLDRRTKGSRKVETFQKRLDEIDAASQAEQTESRGSKAREIEITEETPEQAIENKELMKKIVEGDISAAGTLVQKNSGLILGPKLLNFNPDITTQSGVTSEDVLKAVTDMMTPGIVDIVFTKEKTGEQRNKSLAEEYAKEKGEVSTFLGRLARRKKEIYTAAGLDPNKFNLVAIDSSTKQIVDEGSDPKPKPEKEVATTQVDPREFGPVTEGNKLKDVEDIVKVTDKERLTFKKLASKYFDKVSQAVFGMPGKKVKGNASLKYADVKGQPSSSEASKLQNVFKNVEDVRSFIKAMPPYNVATSQTVIDRQGKKIDVSKDVRGRSIAINPTILKKFYQPVTRAIEGISNESGRSLGSTSQTQVYELKPEYRGRITKATIEGLQKSLGITKGELSVPIKGPARTEFGSLLTGLSKMYVDNLINTVGRSKLTTDQAKADTGAGKSKAMASKRIKNAFQAATSGPDALGFNRFNYEYEKVIPQLLKGEKIKVKDKNGKDIEVDVEPFDMKTPEGVKRFLDYAISSGITKRVPRELWISLAFTSENLLKDTTKKSGKQVKETLRLLKSLQEDPSDNVFGEIEGAVISPTTGIPRGYAGNLPFRSTIEARQWIADSIDAEYNRLKNDKDLNLTDAQARKQADALFPKKGSSEFSNLFTKTDVFTNKNNLETKLDDPAFVKSQDAKINELKKFFKLLQNEVMRDANNNIDFQGVAFVGAMLSSSSAGTSHFLRNAAPMRFYQEGYRDSDIGGSSNVTIEHTMPATLVGKYLFMSAVEGDIDAKFKVVKDNYVQGPLLKVDDDKLKSSIKNKTKGFPLNPFNYTEQMPDFWQDTDSVWGRYFNVNVIRNGGGINPATIMFGKGESALSRFNVMADGTIINDATKKGLPALEKQNNSSLPNSLASKRNLSTQQQVSQQSTLDNALSMGRRTAPPIKKIRIFDFDDTLARSKSMVIVNMPFLDANNEMANVVARRMFKDEFKNLPGYKQTFKSLNADQQKQVLQSIPGKTKKINATEFAQQAADLEAIGATFDFTEFSKVVEGQKGPLFDVAKKIADARGTEDLFILTARPQEAAGPIKKFMKALGIDIPLANITGLADGTAQAKAMWVADKAAQGYNDFYFADDATKNVKAVKDVLSQLDVKSKVQQARASKRLTFNTVVNDMIEDSSGIESFKKFSSAKARTVGRDKGRFDWLTMSSSAEDFKGLLYSLLGRGKKGEAQYEFLKTNLIDPYNRAEDTIIQAKVSAANDFMALKEQFPGLPKTLETETGVGKFTYQHALRTYIWTQQGMSIPGLSKRDATQLNKFIADDPKLKSFADGLIGIQKGKPYPKPGEEWLGGNLTTDIIGGINKVNRKEYQQEWQENVDIIFSPENLNKMEAAYGTRWRKALENTLKRMKAGTNRLGYTDSSNGVLDWVNNSVGAVMFLNTKSALLQTISAVNFLNWGDNNIIKAGAAFANQKQYWADFMKLINSDYLVQRRNGLKINVSESEIADAVKDSQNKPKAAIAFLLSKGFVFTRYADSFAIATGGSTFYRNRIKKYLKEGMDQKLAEQKAFEDFKDVAEESQQSSDPSKISMQQASAAGRVILNWANTPMQYIRIQKRDLQDLIAGRGDPKVKIARIAYYGVVQNLIFNALQQALFAIGFGDDDEEEDSKKKARDDKRISRIANGMVDSQLKGLGIAGMGMVAVKNTLMKIYEESGKQRPEYEKAAIEALSFSPAISSKYRKIVGGLKSFSWNMKEMKQKGFSLDNPAYLAGAQIITAVTNIPIDRVIKKANNIRGILSEQSQMWQKVSMALGYSSYDVGLPYYGSWDKPVEPTPEELKRQEFDIMKKDTKTQEQIDTLLDLGLNKKEIKALGKEDNRVKKIIELQKAKKDSKVVIDGEEVEIVKPKESSEAKLRRQFDSIKAENKPDQVKTLTKFGLTKKEIKDLRYEKNRVEKILELMDK